VVFELDRWAVVEGGVQAFGVEPVDPGGGLPLDDVAAGPGPLPVDEFGLVEAMVDSISALSRASPTEPIEPAMPASSSASLNARDVYCDPASE
jgi:hypothetical protein